MIWVAAIALASALAAPFAQAAPTVVGQTGIAPNVKCEGGPQNYTYVQTGVAEGASYTVPGKGLLTSWSFHFGTNTLPGLTLKVMRPTGVFNSYEVIAESGAGAEQVNTVKTYPIGVPVEAGDLLGYYAGGSAGRCLTETGLVGDYVSYYMGNLALNSSSIFTLTAARLPVSATLQPPPTVSSLSPPSGPPTGGTQVTIQGKISPAPPGSASAERRSPSTSTPTRRSRPPRPRAHSAPSTSGSPRARDRARSRPPTASPTHSRARNRARVSSGSSRSGAPAGGRRRSGAVARSKRGT